MLLLFAALSVVMTWPLAGKLSTHTVDVGVDDPLLCARMLDHQLAWLSGQRRLFDLNFFFPHPNVFTTTDISLGFLYSALPFLPFTQDRLTLVNLGTLLSFVLTGHAAFLLVRGLTRHSAAGLVAGAAAAFCLWRVHQLDHWNVLQMQWWLYLACALLWLREGPSPGRALLVAVLTFVTFSATVNLGIYSVALSLAFGLYVLASLPEGQRARGGAYTVGAVALGGVMLVPIYAPYLLQAKLYDIQRAVGEIQLYSGRVEQLGAAPAFSRLYGPGSSHLMGRESLTFLGWSVLVLALAGLLLPELSRREHRTRALVLSVVMGLGTLLLVWQGLEQRGLAVAAALLLLAAALGGGRLGAGETQRAAWLFASVAVFYFFASLGPEVYWHGRSLGPGLWAWVMKLPGYSTVRTPARFHFATSLAVAVLAGIGLSALLQPLRSRTVQGVLGALALGLVLYELHCVPLPLRGMITFPQAPPVYAWLASQPGKGAVVELPVIEGLERYRMFFSIIHGRPTVDAESGFMLPACTWVLHPNMVTGAALPKLEALRWAGLEYAVLYPNYLPLAAQARYREVLGRAGARLATTFPGIEVWRFNTPGAPLPFTPENVVANVATGPALSVDQPLPVRVELAPKGNVAVYEQEVRRLTVIVEAEGRSFRAPLYLAPPLLVPSQVEARSVDVPVKLPAGKARLALRVEDEEGRVFASAEGELLVTTPDAWAQQERSLRGGPCELQVLSSTRAPEGGARLLVRAGNRTQDAWAGTAHPIVIWTSAGGEQGPRLTPPATAAGEDVLLTLSIPRPSGEAVRMRVLTPDGAERCATDAALP
ncbi:hypothetical protein [Archangium sp.]|uniref:hypothetical protein n=1 Tax=Archangium sp. TaxID=1872627 RepID=UPI002ED7ACFF